MTSADLRCPSCSSRLPDAAVWCSLCFTDLRPRREPDTGAGAAGGPVNPVHEGAAEPDRDRRVAVIDPVTGPVGGELEPALVELMMAELAAATPKSSVAHLAVWVCTPARQAAAAAVGIVFLMVLLIVSSTLSQLLF